MPIPNDLTVPKRLLPLDLPGQVGELAFHKPCELRMRGVVLGPLFRMHLSPIKHLGHICSISFRPLIPLRTPKERVGKTLLLLDGWDC